MDIGIALIAKTLRKMAIDLEEWNNRTVCSDSSPKKAMRDMSDCEFYIECSKLLSKMCDSMQRAHLNMAELAKDSANEKLMKPMLEFSMQICLEGVGDILNGIDLGLRFTMLFVVRCPGRSTPFAEVCLA